jgi:hypothetical protein
MTRMTTERRDDMTSIDHSNGPVQLIQREVPRTLGPAARSAVILGIVVGAAMVIASAVIHLHLWSQGQKDPLGHAFLFQWISGFAVALALLAYRRLISVAAGVGWCGGSIAAMLYAQLHGFLGSNEPISSPYGGWALTVESVGFVVLLACSVPMLRRR